MTVTVDTERQSCREAEVVNTLRSASLIVSEAGLQPDAAVHDAPASPIRHGELGIPSRPPFALLVTSYCSLANLCTNCHEPLLAGAASCPGCGFACQTGRPLMPGLDQNTTSIRQRLS